MQNIRLLLPSRNRRKEMLYGKGPQPLGCGPLPGCGLLGIAPCDWLAGAHVCLRTHSSTCTSGRHSCMCTPACCLHKLSCARRPATHAIVHVFAYTPACHLHGPVLLSPPPRSAKLQRLGITAVWS